MKNLARTLGVVVVGAAMVVAIAPVTFELEITTADGSPATVAGWAESKWDDRVDYEDWTTPIRLELIRSGLEARFHSTDGHVLILSGAVRKAGFPLASFAARGRDISVHGGWRSMGVSVVGPVASEGGTIRQR